MSSHQLAVKVVFSIAQTPVFHYKPGNLEDLLTLTSRDWLACIMPLAIVNWTQEPIKPIREQSKV
jgi:hypothetical protein